MTNIWVIGDSTVSSFEDTYYYPRFGWGTQLSDYLDEECEVINIALSGRSSKSYTAEPEYKVLLEGMKKGDWLLIGFGHNDEKMEEARFTEPNGDYKTEGSFANSIFVNYIVPADNAGTKVILCTPIVRRTETDEWQNQNLHITEDAGTYKGGDYGKAVRNLGSTLGIPVVDMTSKTKELYDAMGPEQTVYLHAWNSSKIISVDNTHTNIWGAKYNAYIITREIRKMDIELSKHVIEDEAPAKEDALEVYPEYKEIVYSNNLKQSEVWKDFGIWKGTVFGDVMIGSMGQDFVMESDSEGDMHIAVNNNNGKISEKSDGVAMYYYRVPSQSTFTLSADAVIHSYFSNDQVSFGLMARDDMYIDTYIADVCGDYVAAGPLKLTQAGNVWNCYARKSGVLTKGGTCLSEYQAKDKVSLTIERTSDGYSCSFGNETVITGGFDFQLTSVDPDYVYIGMFVSRNADVTFRNIRLCVDGEAI